MRTHTRLASIQKFEPPFIRNGNRSLTQLFSDIAQTTSREVGRARVFALAVLRYLAARHKHRHHHHHFLMVFPIQNSQNRDAAAIQIWLNELIRVSKDCASEILGSRAVRA